MAPGLRPGRYFFACDAWKTDLGQSQAFVANSASYNGKCEWRTVVDRRAPPCALGASAFGFERIAGRRRNRLSVHPSRSARSLPRPKAGLCRFERSEPTGQAELSAGLVELRDMSGDRAITAWFACFAWNMIERSIIERAGQALSLSPID